MYTWEQVSPMGKVTWAPRDGAGGLVFDGRMWLLGGWNCASDCRAAALMTHADDTDDTVGTLPLSVVPT